MLYPTHTAAMEPLLPGGDLYRLRGLSRTLFLRAGSISGQLPPATTTRIAALVRGMNSYYSNLIEGHRTYPGEIEEAEGTEIPGEPKKAALVRLGRAHEAVEALMRERLDAEPELEICGAGFTRWLHAELYARLPDEFHRVKGLDGRAEYPVRAGEFRDHPAGVGRHGAPDHRALDAFMRRFEDVYRPAAVPPTDQLIAAMAAHHRFMWIHPFSDGNGRVARLMTTAYLIRAGIDSSGLWAWSRGLARRHRDYYGYLADADQPRRGERDGRGALSEASLRKFIEFAMETALDQMDFMLGKLDLLGMEGRLEDYFLRERPVGSPKQAGSVVRVLVEVLRRGELPRGAVGPLIGKAERTASILIKKIESRGYVTSEGPKRPLRIAFPPDLRDACFPQLFIPA